MPLTRREFMWTMSALGVLCQEQHCLCSPLESSTPLRALDKSSKVDFQPFVANVSRVLNALNLLGEPVRSGDVADITNLASSVGEDRKVAVLKIQEILDLYCLVGVRIDSQLHLRVSRGPATPELVEKGWRLFLIKVENQAGITPPLIVTSSSSEPLAESKWWDVGPRFLDIEVFGAPPLQPILSGLEIEYLVMQVYCRDAGSRIARLGFTIDQPTEDLDFKNPRDLAFQRIPSHEVDIPFVCRATRTIKMSVRDADGTPETGSFIIRDSAGRIYPPATKRLAPDFPFQPQVYRSDGDDVQLPSGAYSIEYTRGPEYLKKLTNVQVTDETLELTFGLERWIDAASRGWYSGDHHIHAAGCAHYSNPTEGVFPADIARHVRGEDLKVGAILTWQGGWYFQKTFFEGRGNSSYSTDRNIIHYDIEVSGFPSNASGHPICLNLATQDYPGTNRTEDWPSWTIPVLRWAKSQGAITGYAHAGWGLSLQEEKLLSYEIPPYDGVGANEYIVSVTQPDLVDFLGVVDTPYAWELNMWYHTLNVGYRTRIGGETDFPCIYGERIGVGRSYVYLDQNLSYENWLRGLQSGASYVSDGKSHIFDFSVNNQRVGVHSSELPLPGPSTVQVSATIAALLPTEPDRMLRNKSYDDRPFWDIERSRIGESRFVAVELVVNGHAVAKQNILADGKPQQVEFSQFLEYSSWVALRILPSSHTNPIFVVVDSKPIRVSKKSVGWCLAGVDQCWKQKSGHLRTQEREDAERAYDSARKEYSLRFAESVSD